MSEDHTSNLLREDICNLLDSIQPPALLRDKSRNFRIKPLETIHEDKVKSTKKMTIVGLSENKITDFETKDKARKGLLWLLNKASGGTFCKDIIGHFENIKFEQILKKREAQFDKEKKSETNTKFLKRQNVIERVGTNNVYSVGIDVDDDIFKLDRNLTAGRSMNLNRNKTAINQEKTNASPLKFKHKATKKILEENENSKFIKKYKNDVATTDRAFELLYGRQDYKDNTLKKQLTKFKPLSNAKTKKKFSITKNSDKSKDKPMTTSENDQY